MRQRHVMFWQAIFVVLVSFAGAAVFGWHPQPAHAQVPPGYSITIIPSSTTMVYQQASPSYIVNISMPPDDSPDIAIGVEITVDGTNFSFTPINNGNNTYTTKFPGLFGGVTFPVGQYQLTASFKSNKLQKTITSDPILLIVQKATPTLTCYMGNNATSPNIYINETLTGNVALVNATPPLDPATADISIAFIGKQTYSFPHVKLDSMANFTVQSPPVPGNYQVQCSFAGDATYAATTSTNNILVSNGIKPGKLSLYTTPATLTSNQMTDFYITVAAAPGYPIPTGFVQMIFGSQYTKLTLLTADGTLHIHDNAPFLTGLTQFTLYYCGDVVYHSDSMYLTFTNPQPPATPTPVPPKALPTTPAAAPTAPAATKPTATSTAATPTTTETPTTAPTTTPISGKTTLTENHPGSGASLPTWVVVSGVGGLAVLSFANVVFFTRRRRLLQALTDAASGAAPPQDIPVPELPPLADQPTEPRLVVSKLDEQQP